MNKMLMLDPPAHFVEWRKRTGADQWDEMWEGVLHVPPMSTNPHQDLGGGLHVYLTVRWALPRKAKVYYEVNLASIGGWPRDYRIPDLLLLTRDRFSIDQGEYFEGAPNAVVEIHSPGDEAYEKLPFYAKLGVTEVWIIDRDNKMPEVYVLRRGKYKKQPVAADGWVRSPATGIDMKQGRKGKLAIRIDGDDATLAELPED
jgi:Uma2 family endonuclease